MKNFNLLAVASLIIASQVVAGTAEARSKTRHKTAKSSDSVSLAAAREQDADSSMHMGRMGAGLATSANLTGSTTALTGIMEFDGGNAVQVYAGVATTSPSFTFGVAGLFKHTLFGNEDTGLHVGGGLGLGSGPGTKTAGNVFTMSLDGDVGVHALFPGTHNVLLSVDGGPSLFIIDGNANFTLGGFSPGIGFSVNYLF